MFVIRRGFSLNTFVTKVRLAIKRIRALLLQVNAAES